MELQTRLTVSDMNQGSLPAKALSQEWGWLWEPGKKFRHLWWKLCNLDKCFDYAVVIPVPTKVSSHKKKTTTHLSIIAKQNDVKKKGNTSFMDVIAKTESTLWWYLRLCLNSVVFTYFILSHIHKASSGFLNSLLSSSALRQVGSTCIRIWLNNHTLERNLSICLLST